MGYQDNEGNFYITDRVKDLSSTRDSKYRLLNLEGLLVSHNKIDDVAVIGKYNKDEATEVPHVYVVLKKGVKADKETEKRITDWLASKVASHKRLRGGVKFIDKIPKSASGKILRRLLKERALAEEKSQKAKLEMPVVRRRL